LTIRITIGNITTMIKSQTIKIWKTTLDNLRMIYAITGRPMIEILDEVIRDKLKELKNGRKD